jgi:hypothetical protein
MGITGLTECFEEVVFDEEVAHAFISLFNIPSTK